MNLIWIGLAVCILATAGAVWLRRPPAGAQTRRLSAPPATPAAAPAPAAVAAAVPEELARFRPRPATELPAERRAAVLQVFRDVPRPSRLMQHLLSPDFFGNASSAQLVDLISAEPLIAAKVLATVNSSMYGLNAPVSSIRQAVTYLGLNAVRSLCLQILVWSSFICDNDERRRLLEQTWTAGALASELCQRLSHDLAVDDGGELVSAVVLSFLGRIALVATTPTGILTTLPTRGHLARKQAEQDRLGVCSAEIGYLLMTDWNLPESVVADASALDRMLVTPATELVDGRMRRLALGYACARLGERLAEGDIADLATFDLAADRDIDLFHLRGALGSRPLSHLPKALRSSELAASLQRMLRASRV